MTSRSTRTPDLPPIAQADVDLADEAATIALGANLARGLTTLARTEPPTLTVFFSGDLGAGKTTLVRALLRGLGVTGRIKSPTFALVEPYEIALEINDKPGLELKRNLSLYCYHFDFYRFTEPREFLEAGFREYFDGTALCLVEWPERVQGDPTSATAEVLPRADLEIRLDHDGAGRRAHLRAASVRGAACLNAAVS